jgi:hypothetical protein
MAKVSTYLFWLLIVCIAAIVVIQLFSSGDKTDFYKIMDTIIKVVVGAWGGAALSEKDRGSKK